VPRLARALAAAFEDDPVFGWLIPHSAPRRRARLTRNIALELSHLEIPAGAAWTTPALEGAALSLPPGKWRMPVGVTFGHAPAFARVFGHRIGHALAIITWMEQKHIREPHHYLPYIGVAPAAQGRGLGTALMAPVLDQADADGLPAYLEATSERNAKLYARLGFETLDELRVLGSPPLTLMRRPAATAS
jgi:GNAT superfamily N-acetyltransferase